MMIDGQNAAGYYQSLTAEREPFLRRARDVSTLTLPTLVPPEGHSNQTLPTPYQGLGARGVNSLASKLLLALFPPNQSFIRLRLSAKALSRLGEGEARSEVDAALAGIEKALDAEMERRALRPFLHEAKKHLLIAGNCILHIPREGQPKVVQLKDSVIKRDPSGNVLSMVIREEISPRVLSEEVLESASQIDPNAEVVEIYTAIVLREKKYHVYQEVGGEILPNSEGVYKPEHLPWIPLRMEPISGQSYGYGYVANLLGDLSSLEGLWKSLVEAAAVSARTVFLVNPSATTKISHLNRAPNGSFVSGMADDISVLKVDKGGDMGVAFQAIEQLSRGLGFSFLLNQSVQRSGERVTAEEIRFLAQELEDVLAGTYSLLAQEEQLPIVRLMLHHMESRGEIEKLDDVALPTIVTGLEALGRGHDLIRLDTFVQGANTVLGPQALMQYLNTGDYLTRRATAVGIQSDGLIRSEEEVQQMNQQQQQASLTQSVAPEAVRQMGKQLETGE